MVLLIVGIDTVRCQDNFPGTLVGVNRCHTDTGMRVNSGEDKRIGIQSREYFIEIRPVERTVPFLDHH